jgi:hypothetical protein
MELREDYIEDLDKMLSCLYGHENLIDKAGFISRGALPRDISDADYKNYVHILCEVCAGTKHERGGPWYLVSDERTIHFYKSGGFRSYYERLKREEEKRIKKEKKELDYLDSQTVLNKWLYKAKWFPYIASLVALIISIWSLIAQIC